mmetsp:Transcript_50654/g.105824  ORF Transcript_50654/g.105824 Transcript_50654/m.105824 type:complete len:85 (-) Transcript_50654:161-415(-)
MRPALKAWELVFLSVFWTGFGWFCFYQWDGELVNKSSFGPFVYWFSFLYSHLSKICGILFAFFTLQGLATQLTGRPEGSKKARK